MDKPSLEAILADIPLSAIRYFESIDSTNEEAWRWVDDGAPHLSMVVADEQTAGRGRLNRSWVTQAGTGLAFSLVLSSPPLGVHDLSRLTGLGALAVCLALDRQYSLPAKVKWPNDILLDQRKAGGVLAETRWNGESLKAVVIGIGINVAPISTDRDSFAALGFSFPATCVEDVLHHPVDRMELLHTILQDFFRLLPKLASQHFMETWEGFLAFRGQWVELSSGINPPSNRSEAVLAQPILGKVLGLSEHGALRLQTVNGQVITIPFGEIHLGPAASPSPG